MLPTTTRVPPPSYIRRSSPRRRKIEWPLPLSAASGSLPRAARSTSARFASSCSRPGDRAQSGSRTESCSGLARRAPASAVAVIGSELEYLVVLQHSWPQAADACLDLFHDQFDLAGLQVGNPDIGAPLELGQFLGKHRRTQVPGDFGKVLFLVRKGGFDDQNPEVRNLIDDLPQFVVRTRVAGEHQAPLAGVQMVSNGGHRMDRGQRGDLASADGHRAPQFDFLVAQEWRLRRRNLGEI